MNKVLDTDLYSMADCDRIESKTRRFSREFSVDISYFD
jgi:hypothetical protein